MFVHTRIVMNHSSMTGTSQTQKPHVVLQQNKCHLLLLQKHANDAQEERVWPEVQQGVARDATFPRRLHHDNLKWYKIGGNRQARHSGLGYAT